MEAPFSEGKARRPRQVQAVTTQGFRLTVALLVITFAFEKITP